MSDMSEPWPQTTSFMSNTLSNPYHRLMNTSGMAFRDHAGSMDLCHAALQFASDTLKHNGHFICKFYEGNESKQLETKLRRMFKHVHRVKPYSSRKVCLLACLLACVLSTCPPPPSFLPCFLFRSFSFLSTSQIVNSYIYVVSGRTLRGSSLTCNFARTI